MKHIVRQGEYLSRIARQYGYSDWKTIWNDPANATLKDKRKNPNILYPGDEVFIPDKSDKHELRATDKQHRFTVKRTPLKLIVVLDRRYARPLANVHGELSMQGDSSELSTDGKGKFERDITPMLDEVRVTTRDSKTAIDDQGITLRVGYLDPIDQESGQRERLNNLGYGASIADDADADEKQRVLRSAIEEFQCDNQLTVDGICGPQTQAKAMPEDELKEATKHVEYLKAAIRSKVEYPFRVVKRQFGYQKARFKGLLKNSAQVLTLFALSNLWMVRRTLLASAGEMRL